MMAVHCEEELLMRQIFEFLLAVFAFLLGWVVFKALGKGREGVESTGAHAQQIPGPSSAVSGAKSWAEGSAPASLLLLLILLLLIAEDWAVAATDGR